jgi:proteasome lid subunit RPN8/RPN11
MVVAEQQEALTLPRSYVEAMIRHARAFVPQECCGLIAGQEGRAVKRYELRNDDPSVLRYTANAQDQLAAMREMWDHDWDLLAIYHSHTHTQAYPSATDVRLAFYPDAYYVIVSLQEPDRPVVRAFRIVDGTIAEHELRVTESDPSVLP